MPRVVGVLVLVSALPVGAGIVPTARAQTPREAALAVLERASRPFATYCARNGNDLTVVAELSASSIQAGRWKEGADVEVVVSSQNGRLASGKGRIEPGTYATTVRVPVASGASPSHVSVSLRANGEAPADDWVKLYPPSGTLVGEPIAYRSASRIATRPVAAFEFARNERLRIEWPELGSVDRRESRLLDRTGRVLLNELPLTHERNQAIVDMSLSGLPHGDYVIELAASAGTVTEHHMLAIRIR